MTSRHSVKTSAWFVSSKQ